MNAPEIYLNPDFLEQAQALHEWINTAVTRDVRMKARKTASFGVAYKSLVFRNKGDRTVEFDYPLPEGSLLYMSEEIQQEWLHSIPKKEGAGMRISLTFRAIVSPS